MKTPQNEQRKECDIHWPIDHAKTIFIVTYVFNAFCVCKLDVGYICKLNSLAKISPYLDSWKKPTLKAFHFCSDRVPNSKAAANNTTDSETVSKNSFVKISSSSIVDLVSEPGDAGDEELPVYDDSEAITVVPLDEEGLYKDEAQNNNIEDIATVLGHGMPEVEDDPAEHLQNIEESRESEATSHLSNYILFHLLPSLLVLFLLLSCSR